MTDCDRNHQATRRGVVTALAAAPIGLVLGGCGARTRRDNDGGFTCRTDGDVEGPYYSPDAPEVGALADDDEPGDRILITGRLVDASDCARPLAGWTIDLWHANDAGEYDLEGYNLRGRVVTDDDGGFVVETILPGRYSTRPVRHIHFKVWSADGVVALTSQIYFPSNDYEPDRHTGPLVSLDDDNAATVLLAV
jgi:protocatechuate 3,4-dioxygenase beta subunit